MSFLNKLGMGIGIGGRREISRPVASNGPRAAGAAVAAKVPRPPDAPESARISNGLKEFLWNLDGLKRGVLLDLGPAWQATLSFFIERGFRVSSEDILREWQVFLAAEQARLRAATSATEPMDVTSTGRAARFLLENLRYSPASFDAILLWDTLDYLEAPVAKQAVACLTEFLRPGGIVFAMFHSKKPEGFHRYRVVDSNTLQVVSTPFLCPAQRVYQNREIQDLFSCYRTVKSFVGRDQLRETVFVK